VASCPILGRGYAQQEVIHAPDQRLTDPCPGGPEWFSRGQIATPSGLSIGRNNPFGWSPPHARPRCFAEPRSRTACRSRAASYSDQFVTRYCPWRFRDNVPHCACRGLCIHPFFENTCYRSSPWYSNVIGSFAGLLTASCSSASYSIKANSCRRQRNCHSPHSDLKMPQ
jgi:hypothetical protein